MNEKLIEKKLFIFDQYEDEESYLRDKHKQGWKFVKIERRITTSEYYFEKCEPTEVAYQLDYFDDAKDDSTNTIEEKIEFYTDDGWEVVARDINHWYYFRKNIEDGKSLLYSDPTTKIEMAKKATNKVSIILTIALIILTYMQSSHKDILIIESLNLYTITSLMVIVLYEVMLGMTLYYMGRALAFERRYSKIIEGDFHNTGQKTRSKIPLFWVVLSILLIGLSILAYTNGNIGDFCRGAFVWIALGVGLAFWMTVFGVHKQVKKI